MDTNAVIQLVMEGTRLATLHAISNRVYCGHRCTPSVGDREGTRLATLHTISNRFIVGTNTVLQLGHGTRLATLHTTTDRFTVGTNAVLQFGHGTRLATLHTISNRFLWAPIQSFSLVTGNQASHTA